MAGVVLERNLYSVIRRLQKLRLLRSQAICWLLLLIPAIGATLWLPPRVGAFSAEAPVVLVATLLGVILARMLVRNPSRTEAARLIEKTDPDVNDAVITAVQVADQAGRRPSVLAAMAIQEADELARRRDWSGVVPGLQILKWTALSFLSFLVMVSSVMAAGRYGRGLMIPETVPGSPKLEKKISEPVTQLVIEPGDTDIELGSALTVVARFPGVVPGHVTLEFVSAKNETRQVSMSETVDAGVFAARLEEISGDGTYRVLYQREEPLAKVPESSATFRVTTFVRPKLERLDVVVTPPAWSGRPQETVEDVVRLTVTEGSTVTLNAYLNKPVTLAELRPKDGAATALAGSPQNPQLMSVTTLVTEDQAWSLFLQDAQGRTAAEEERITIRVTRNEPAKIKATFPGRDTNVSPLQEFLVEAKASDDFGVVDYGVQFSVSGQDPQDVSLKPQSPAAPVSDSATPALPEAVAVNPENAAVSAPLMVDMSHRIDLESMQAAPDDLVTYSFWASDIAVDGTERKTYSDLMFAEVRRFEEIFREGQQNGQQQRQQQQQQQQQQQGSAVDGVLSLQKEILSATWNTIRRESASRQAGTFSDDVKVIADSQNQSLQQLEAALEELQSDPKTIALGQRAGEEMTKIRQQLEDVHTAKEGAKLNQTLPTEQSVIQTLLKMRAAEFQVRQQQQGGGGGGGGGNSASQQQLQQLELDNNRNRYESEQRAQQQEEMTTQQREQLQVLNRLKELARRQQMVNERLKQLESELRMAKTDSEREEIERELKRLREEQREMLRDVDELSERMDRAADQENPQSSEMRQQMQEARSNVQQASRAMDEGRLSEAISEGTRAERQFEDLKEDFRNQTSSRFDDAVRDLRDQARELSEREEQLGRQLAGEPPTTDSSDRKSGAETSPAKQQKPSLRSDRNAQELQDAFREQRDRLNRVVDEAKQMLEQAEQTEPLLSSKLYEAVRDLKDSQPEKALEATEFLAGRGLWDQSQQAEQAARAGIEQLRKGIEQAADSVLGSEAESLRRAQTQLEDATRKLQSELRSATGESRESEDGQPQQNSEENPDGRQNATQGQESGEPQNSDNERTSNRRPGQRGNDQPGNQDSRSPGKRSTVAARDQQGSQPSGESREEGSPEEGSRQEGQPTDPSQPATERSAEQQQSKSGASGRQPGGNQENQDSQNSGQNSEQPGQPSGNQPSASEQGGQPSGESQSPQNQTGQGGSGNQADRDPAGQRQNGQRRSGLLEGGREDNGGGGANNAAARPLTGNDFSEWSDQLRDVEEMLDDPELRNRVVQVRDRARAMRAEFKRHSKMPEWDMVRSQLLGEMQALQKQIAQELSRLESDRAMVPIDREPVPEEFDQLVQRYYELLGQQRENAVAPESESLKNDPALRKQKF